MSTPVPRVSVRNSFWKKIIKRVIVKMTNDDVIISITQASFDLSSLPEYDQSGITTMTNDDVIIEGEAERKLHLWYYFDFFFL